MRRFLLAFLGACTVCRASVTVQLTFSQTGPFDDCCSTNFYSVVDLSAVQSLANSLDGMISSVDAMIDVDVQEIYRVQDLETEARGLVDEALASLDAWAVDNDYNQDIDDAVSSLYSAMDDFDSMENVLSGVLADLWLMQDVLNTPQSLTVDGQVLAYTCSGDGSGSGGGSGGGCPCPPYIQAVHDYLANTVAPLLRTANTHLNNIYNSVYVMETHIASWTPLFTSWDQHFSDWNSNFHSWNSTFSAWSTRFSTWSRFFSNIDSNVDNIDQNLGYIMDDLIYFVEGDGSQAVYTFGELLSLLQLVQAGGNIRYVYPTGWQFYGTNQTSILDNIRDINSKLPFSISFPSSFAVTNSLLVSVTNDVKVVFTNSVDLDVFTNFFTVFNDSTFDSAGWSNMRLFFSDYYDDSQFWENASESSVTNLTFDDYAELNWFEKISCVLWSINVNVAAVAQQITGGVDESQMQAAADSAKSALSRLSGDVNISASTLMGHMSRFKSSLNKLRQNNGSHTIRLWDDFQPFPSGSDSGSKKVGSSNISITIPAAVIDLDNNDLYNGLRSVMRSAFQVFWSFILGIAMVACHWYVIAFAFSVIMWAWRSAAEMRPVSFKFFGVWSIGDGFDV